MKKLLSNGLGMIALASMAVSTGVAASRPCDDNQVYLAVMESARHDLPAPYSDMEVKGSTGVTSLKNGQCKMTLFLTGGSNGQQDLDVLYKTTVPLSQIHVKLASSTENTQKASNKCTPIKFQRGHISGTVNGSVNPEDTQCYTVATGANQTMDVTVVSRYKNTVATILDVGDARDHFEFLTKKKTYQIDVFQLMRSADNDEYSLTVTIR
ncbi:hypothetical protein [Methylovulum psychrotolerans]|uniref:Uncharacterized protein n=1 Tax=Methylovulum psychrotolerans TaxID=1704499 RepID=A0A1Z4BVA8_9GAMM|nr:hypothetical protein [Methylovulum psychrotolerans]ASF45225.1 hypothetical protein CEK71_03635 [Methylovulum psychrotolerans]